MITNLVSRLRSMPVEDRWFFFALACTCMSGSFQLITKVLA